MRQRELNLEELQFLRFAQQAGYDVIPVLANRHPNWMFKKFRKRPTHENNDYQIYKIQGGYLVLERWNFPNRKKKTEEKKEPEKTMQLKRKNPKKIKKKPVAKPVQIPVSHNEVSDEIMLEALKQGR